MKAPTLLATLIGLVAGVLMTWPMMTAPGTLARMDSYDGKFSVWNVAWVAHALVDDPTNIFNANIFHPHTGTLAYSEANLVAGAIAAPVYAVTHNPVLAHNVVVYVALVLAFVLTWSLVRRLTDSALAGLAPAAGFAFSAYSSAHTAHIQLLMVFVVPLVLLAFHRFVETTSPRRAVELGLALAIAGLACAYYGLMMGMAVGVGAFWFGVRHEAPKQFWPGLVLAVIVTVSVIAPVLAPYAELRDQDGFRSSLNIEEANRYSANHRAFLRGHSASLSLLPDAWSDGLRRYIGGDGEVLFPGVFILILAVAGTLTAWPIQRPQRRKADRTMTPQVVSFYGALTLLALWASLGPRAGLYTVLADWVPFMSFLRAPARMGVLVLFSLAVLAGFGLARSERRRPWFSILLLALTMAELQVPWPLRPVPPVAEGYRMLAQLPRGGVLMLQFPYRSGEWFPHADYMFWSMYHWQPMVNGYSDYIPADTRALAVPINGFPDAASFRLLRERHVRYVAIDWRTYNEAATVIMRARFTLYAQYLRPLVTTEPVSLYEIVAWPE
ncbi:MAG: hypothetical protein ABIP90_02610 [Vicinamibacterales bacterium]